MSEHETKLGPERMRAGIISAPEEESAEFSGAEKIGSSRAQGFREGVSPVPPAAGSARSTWQEGSEALPSGWLGQKLILRPAVKTNPETSISAFRTLEMPSPVSPFLSAKPTMALPAWS